MHRISNFLIVGSQVAQASFGRVTLTLFLLLFPAIKSLAQIPRTWSKEVVAKGWAPVSITFSDTLHCVILADSAGRLTILRSFMTSDGGRTWTVPGAYPTLGASLNLAYRPMTTVGSRLFFFLAQSALLPPERSQDAGFSWTASSGYPFAGNVIGCRMFDAARGYVADANGNSVNLYSTADSGNFFTTGIGNSVAATASDAYIRDSTTIWLSAQQSGSKHSRMLKTADAGQSWQAIFPVDTTRYSGTFLYQIVASPNRDYLYVLGGGQQLNGSRYTSNIDFVKTTNAGSTWKSDSGIGGGRIYKLRSPATAKLWAFVGNKMSSGISDLAIAPRSRGFADTLCYSTNNGESWITDANTFLGDTLTDMDWADSTHGCITAWRDSSLIVYRFVPSNAGVSLREAKANQATIHILNSPVSESLSFFLEGVAGDAQLNVIDLLGKKLVGVSRVVTAEKVNDIDLHGLPSGYYTLSISLSKSITVSKGFVKQ